MLSGVGHPGVTGGDAAERCFLTGTPHPERGGFRNGISLDQFAAEEIGNRTRYPSLVLAVTNENSTLSYTRSGSPIPSEKSPRKLFERIFIHGKPSEIAANVVALQQGRSLLDIVGDQSRRLHRSLSKADQSRLDQYYSSVHGRHPLHSRPQSGWPIRIWPATSRATMPTVLGQLGQSLLKFDPAQSDGPGLTAVRRLTRAEYENTIRDLFDIPGIALQGNLPADGSVHGFDKNSEALDLSHVNLAKYVEAAEHTLELATAPRPMRRRFKNAESPFATAAALWRMWCSMATASYCATSSRIQIFHPPESKAILTKALTNEWAHSKTAAPSACFGMKMNP